MPTCRPASPPSWLPGTSLLTQILGLGLGIPGLGMGPGSWHLLGRGPECPQPAPERKALPRGEERGLVGGEGWDGPRGDPGAWSDLRSLGLGPGGPA